MHGLHKMQGTSNVDAEGFQVPIIHKNMKISLKYHGVTLNNTEVMNLYLYD